MRSGCADRNSRAPSSGLVRPPYEVEGLHSSSPARFVIGIVLPAARDVNGPTAAIVRGSAAIFRAAAAPDPILAPSLGPPCHMPSRPAPRRRAVPASFAWSTASCTALRMGMPCGAPGPLVGTCTPIVHFPDGSPVDGRDTSQPRPAAAATRSSTPPASAARARRDSRRRRLEGHAVVPAAASSTAKSSIGSAMPFSWRRPRDLNRTGRSGHRERADGLADQHLARACLCADPRSDVDRRPDVSAVGLDRLARMNADTDPDRLVGCGPGVARDRQAATDGAAHGVEDDVEAVALGLDLRAAESPDRLPGERAVPRQKRRCRRGAMLLHEVGVAPEIREQEAAGDRALLTRSHDGRS